MGREREEAEEIEQDCVCMCVYRGILVALTTSVLLGYNFWEVVVFQMGLKSMEMMYVYAHTHTHTDART